MQNILVDFYRGNINPNEVSFPLNPSCKRVNKEIVSLEKILLSKLNDEEKKLFENFQLLLAERGSFEDTQLFIDAFRLDARMMLEIIIED